MSETSVGSVNENREVIIAYNPRAGAGNNQSRIEELRGLLDQYGYDPVLMDSLEALSSHTAEHASQIHAVVAAGGDGTIEAVVNATQGKLPVAILPLGTENLMAKYLHLDADPQRLIEILSLNRRVQFDAGVANGEIFSIMLSCGFDAEVVRRVHRERTGNITHLAYAKPIMDAIRKYNYPRLTVEWKDAEQWKKLDCHWAFVFNAPAYAAGLQIVTDADPTDGMFEIATFTGGSLWHGFWQFVAVLFRRHRSMPGFKLHRSNHLRIRSKHPQVAFQIDGDPGGILPVEIEVLPKHLTLLVDDSFAV